MHRGAALVLLATVFIVILLPSAIVAFGRGGASLPEPQEEEEGAERENAGLTLRVFEADKDRVVEMDLEEYLMGVVMAEMPVEFALEALKAQAVAARTFTLQRSRRLGGEGCRKAPEAADICTDSTHCQDWIDPELGAGRWPAEKKYWTRSAKPSRRPPARSLLLKVSSSRLCTTLPAAERRKSPRPSGAAVRWLTCPASPVPTARTLPITGPKWRWPGKNWPPAWSWTCLSRRFPAFSLPLKSSRRPREAG